MNTTDAIRVVIPRKERPQKQPNSGKFEAAVTRRGPRIETIDIAGSQSRSILDYMGAIYTHSEFI